MLQPDEGSINNTARDMGKGAPRSPNYFRDRSYLEASRMLRQFASSKIEQNATTIKRQMHAQVLRMETRVPNPRRLYGEVLETVGSEIPFFQQLRMYNFCSPL